MELYSRTGSIQYKTSCNRNYNLNMELLNLFLDPPACTIDYGPRIRLLDGVGAEDHSVCDSSDTNSDTLQFPPSVTKTYCMLETLIHSINDNRKVSKQMN